MPCAMSRATNSIASCPGAGSKTISTAAESEISIKVGGPHLSTTYHMSRDSISIFRSCQKARILVNCPVRTSAVLVAEIYKILNNTLKLVKMHVKLNLDMNKWQ